MSAQVGNRKDVDFGLVSELCNVLLCFGKDTLRLHSRNRDMQSTRRGGNPF